jgi:hypothetical protein
VQPTRGPGGLRRFWSGRLDPQGNDVVRLFVPLPRWTTTFGFVQPALPSIHAISVRVATPDPPFGTSS